jgi:hypothetical protein
MLCKLPRLLEIIIANVKISHWTNFNSKTQKDIQTHFQILYIQFFKIAWPFTIPYTSNIDRLNMSSSSSEKNLFLQLSTAQMHDSFDQSEPQL